MILHAGGDMHRGFEQEDLMAILNGVDDAVIKLDAQAYFVAVNQAAANLYQELGFDPQQLKGKSIWNLFPDLKGTLFERELRRVIQDHVQTAHEFFYPKNKRWYETKGYPASPGAILVFRDITEKKATA
jgi:PAS domain S-box-containing protein